MADRWFEDLGEHDHDPDDPEAVERELRRQERAAKRHGGKKSKPPKTPKTSPGSRLSRPASARTGGRPMSPRTGRRGGGGSRPGRGRLIALGAAGVVAILFVWFLFAFFQPGKGDGEGEPFNVKIPQGASVSDIGSQLADEGVISNSKMFELKATVTGKRSSLYFGNHFFKKNMSYSSALDELGKKPAKVTITCLLYTSPSPRDS